MYVDAVVMRAGRRKPTPYSINYRVTPRSHLNLRIRNGELRREREAFLTSGRF
jgi:hypothetical protein